MKRAAVIAVGAITLVVGAPAAGAPIWGAPVQISTGERALGPELALNAAGDGLAVWDQEVGSDCASSPASLSCIHVVTAAARTRGSATWTTPIDISRPGVGATPRAAIDTNGNAAIVWVHDIGRDRVLQATYRKGPSGVWPEPNDVSEASLEVRNHEIALDAAGNAVAVWAERREQTFDVYAAVRPAVAGGWRAPVRLSGQAHVVSGPDLAITSSGRAAVAWIDGSNMLRVVGGDVPTGVWEGPATPAGPGGLAKRSPRIAVNDAGDIAVTWFTGERGSADDRRVWRAVRSRAGDWQAALLFSYAASSATAPAVALDDAGAITAAWLAPEGVESAMGAVTSDWRVSRMISTTSSASDPHLALDEAGNAVVAWTAGGNESAVRTSIAPASSRAWQAPTTVSRSGASGPVLGMAQTGRAVVVWSVRASARVSIESADLAAQGPLVQLALPPRALIVGVRGRFSVHALAWAASLAGEPRWSFGDGSDASGVLVTHAYARPGRYTITVSQADAAGGESTSTGTVTVVRERVRNTKAPWIQGVPRVGRTLTCHRGGWAGSPPIRFAYAWRRDGKFVAQKMQRRYRLGPDDLGSLISCEVVATNPAGSTRAASALVGVER